MTPLDLPSNFEELERFNIPTGQLTVGRHWDRYKLSPYLASLRKTSREHDNLWVRYKVASALLSEWQDFQSAIPVLIFLSGFSSETEVGGKSLSKMLLEDFLNHDLGFYEKNGGESVRQAWHDFWFKNQAKPLVHLWKEGISEAIKNYVDRENIWVPSRVAFRIALLKGIPETLLSDGEKRREDPIMAKALLEKEQHDLKQWWEESVQKELDYIQVVINALKELAYRNQESAPEYLGLQQLHFAIGLFGCPYRGKAERETGGKPRESTVVERLQYLKKAEEYYHDHREEINQLSANHAIEIS